AAARLGQEQHDRAGQHRDKDGQHHDVAQQELHHGGSLPSTWSVPVMPRSAISTTRNSAVVAKPITIAVSTSACGSGSAYSDGSTELVFSITGALCRARRPMPKMKMLVA